MSTEMSYSEKILHLNQWFKENTKLPEEIDPILLRRFLKCMKGDLEETKQLIELNYRLRNKNPEIFIDRDPKSEPSQKTYQVVDIVTLPGLTPEGYRILCFRLTDSDVKLHNPLEECKVFSMLSDVNFTHLDLEDKTIPNDDDAKVEATRPVKQNDTKDQMKDQTIPNGEDDVIAEAQQNQHKNDKDQLKDRIVPNNDDDDDKFEETMAEQPEASKDQLTDDADDHAYDEEDFYEDEEEFYDKHLADGQIHIMDVGKYTFRHMANMSISLMRANMNYLQEAYPLRLKALHVINCPSYFNRMIAIVRPFVRDDVFNMITFHTEGLESLYEHIPKDMLPAEYGGTQASLTELKQNYWHKIIEKRDYLMDSKQWRVKQTAPSRSSWSWW